jgi:hypothetical protein
MSIDTTDMHAIHRVFRSACRDAPAAFGHADGHDAVGSFYETVLGFLHCHHGAEDALLRPLLSERCPGHKTLLARMDAQHDGVNAALGRAEALLVRWRTDPGRLVERDLVSAIGVLGVELGAHVDDEESHLLPLAAEHLTLEEWGALPGYAMSHFASERKWLLIGLVRRQMTDSQLAHMNKSMPPPAVEAWLSSGSKAFATFMASMPALGMSA